MDSLYDNSTSDPVTPPIDYVLVRKIWLIILSILIGPSVICSFIMVFWMLKMYDLWTRLTNHIIIVNFLVNFVQVCLINMATRCNSIENSSSMYHLQAMLELPFAMAYMSSGYTPFTNFHFCKFWIAFEYSLNVSTLFLNVQLSFERYLLIFHQNLLYR